MNFPSSSESEYDDEEEEERQRSELSVIYHSNNGLVSPRADYRFENRPPRIHEIQAIRRRNEIQRRFSSQEEVISETESRQSEEPPVSLEAYSGPISVQIDPESGEEEHFSG